MAPATGLRANLTTYGDQEFALFLRKAFIKGAGYSDDALDRPIVGILDTSSGYNPCHANIFPLIEAVKRGVLLTGALPISFPTISLHESFAHPTSMYLRNLMSMDVEEMIHAQPMDSVILIGGCDKTVPAELMGAISANKPAVQLVTGPMLTSTYIPIDQDEPRPQSSIIPNRGERIGACTDCRRLWANYRAGEIDIEELGRVNELLVPGPGTCSVMGTASTMACIAEALGMAPLGSSTPPAVSAARQRVAETVGRIGARLAGAGDPVLQVGVGIKPTDVLRRENFENAVTVLQAIGGSTNAIIHLLAIAGRVPGAREGMINLTLDDVDIIGRRTPLILDLKPSGTGYMEDFHNEGGLPALLRVLRPLLRLDAMTVTGRTLGEELDLYPPTPQPSFLIRPLSNPVFPCASLIILKGNLAPNGAVLKQSAASSKYIQQEVVGEAIVFDGVEDMTERIDDPDLDVNEKSVLVLRGIGLVGRGGLLGEGKGKGKGKDAGLGMPESGLIPIPKKLARRGVKDILRISDGRMSGTGFGSVVLHVSPEGGGHDPSNPELPSLLALIKTGDHVRLDVPKRIVEMLLSPEEIERRKEAWVRTRQHQEENSGQKPKMRQRGYYQSKRPTTATLDTRLSLLFQTATGNGFFNSKCVLDIGCNEGWVTCEIAQRFNPQHITGVDIDPELVRSAWKRRRTVWSLQQPWSLLKDIDILREKEKEIKRPRKRRRTIEVEEQPQTNSRADSNRLDFDYFPFAMEHMFGPILIPIHYRNAPSPFPHNITFRTADWVSEVIPEDKEGYDIVLAFSISKWIHLNKGDDGLRLFFRKVYDVLKPGGSFILEPQPWNSYAKARKMDEKLKQSYHTLQLRPHDFSSVLLNEIGFDSRKELGRTGERGFDRPVDIYTKTSSPRLV